MNDRYRARAAVAQVHTQKRAIFYACAALLLCMGGLGIMVAGVFRVHHVEVVGARLPSEAIVQAARVQNQNVFGVQSDQVVTRLSALHEVTISRVETSFPDRVTIYASRRPPVAALQTPKALFELDGNGMVIRQVSATHLPTLTAPEVAAGLGPGVMQAVKDARSQLPPAPAGAIQSLTYTRAQGLVVQGKAGWSADIGNGSPQIMRTRIYTLASFLRAAQSHPGRLQFVDLRLSQPYARFQGA